MPFIQVVDVGGKPHGFQRTDTANTQKNLLLEAVLIVATVELVGKRTVFPAVLVDVGIEQVEGDAAYFQYSNFSLYFPAQQVYTDFNPVAIFIAHRRNGQLGKFLGWEIVDLVTVEG